uniref:Uncharacterized protein n=1 Tax=Quercus lobata TaxID=97700 RepID=A0A7N2M2S1_QUELO
MSYNLRPKKSDIYFLSLSKSKWGVCVGSIKFCVYSPSSFILLHFLFLLPCLQSHLALLYSILITLFLFIKMLLLLLIKMLSILNIDIIFICVIILIQRQPLGRRIQTAVLGMASSVTKPHAMLLALTLAAAGLEAPFIPTVPLFFLPHLRTLNLAGNCFNFYLISSKFGNFKTLTHLNLSFSCFSGKIPYEISHLSSLLSLDPSYNNGLLIETPVWKRVIHDLTQLRELLLDWSNMSSIRPNSLMNLSSSFTTFSLHQCNLHGKLENNILCLPSIQTLDLGKNDNLHLGSPPKCNWNNSSLKVLDLSSISFSREFLDSISNLKYLKVLVLDNCNFTGSIPSSLSNFTQITYLALVSNSFSGLLPLSLFNLPNLSTLYLHNNQLVGPLPNHISGLLNLKDLYLSSNFLNGTLPSWLFSLPSLVKLYINGNQFIGEIGEFKSNSLEYLDLGYNKLQGSIPRSISRFVNLTYLSLSSNNWISINNNVTYTPPNLYTLNLSSCNISEFPIFLRTPTNIEFLDLSKNRIYGQVPRWLGHVGSDSLYFLDLRNNLLQGPFPTLNFLSMQYLFVSNNKFTGEIPSSICNASALDILDLSHNNLSGMIPKCLVHSNVLSVLDLRMNSLHGTIPATFSTRNRFRNINLNGNQLEGPLPRSLANCRNLEVLDLGSNKINGTFPYWLEGLLNLRVLVLRSNKFQGRIGNPRTKFPFPNLRILDISNNEFNGPLPIKYFKYLKAMTNVDEGKVALKCWLGLGFNDAFDLGSSLPLSKMILTPVCSTLRDQNAIALSRQVESCNAQNGLSTLESNMVEKLGLKERENILNLSKAKAHVLTSLGFDGTVDTAFS